MLSSVLSRFRLRANVAEAITTMRGLGSRADQGHNILLFADKHRLLMERAAIASSLWRRGTHAEFTYPANISIKQVQQYCSTKGISILIVFRVKNFISNQMVCVRTSRAPSSKKQGADIGMGIVSKTGSGLAGDKFVWDAVEIPVGELFNHLRKLTRLGKRTAEDAIESSADTSTNYNIVRDSLQVKLIESSTGRFKAVARKQIISKVRRQVASYVKTPQSAVVCAISLPLNIIRGATAALYLDQSATSQGHNRKNQVNVFKGSSSSPQSKVWQYLQSLTDKGHIVLLKELFAYLQSLNEGAQQLYIYSLVDDRVDMFSL